MSDDDERIARKAYEIWESEGHPHGRDQSHWDQAKEIVALHDSMGDTLLPRDTGAHEPEEPTVAIEPFGDVPGLTDQGRDDLVDTDREPEITKPSHAPVPKTAGAAPAPAAPVTGPGMEKAPIVTPTPASGTVSAAPTGMPPIATPAGAVPSAPDDARRSSALQSPPAGNSAPITGKAPPKPAAAPAPVTRGNPFGRR